jgi:hypothetical protein
MLQGGTLQALWNRVRNPTPIVEHVDMHLLGKLFTDDIRIHLRRFRCTSRHSFVHDLCPNGYRYSERTGGAGL